MSAPQYSKANLRIPTKFNFSWNRILTSLLSTHISAPPSMADQPHPTILPLEDSSQSHVLSTTLEHGSEGINDLVAHESSDDSAPGIARTSGPPLEITSDWVCSSKLYWFSLRTE